MNKQAASTIILCTLLLSVISPLAVLAEPVVKVKKGDWIEYTVVATGNFPGEHNTKWVRMEIVDVQGEVIQVNVTAQLTNDSFVYYDEMVNYTASELLEGFFLPSNATLGTSFYDSLVGNIAVVSKEQKSYGGATRTIIIGEAPSSTYYWDEATGMTVEAHSSYPAYNYSLDTYFNATNMWQPQILGLDPPIFYLTITVVAVAVATVVAVAVLVLRRDRKRDSGA